MANYIIYTDEIVNMRVSCIEADAQAMATANNAYLSLDTFDNYDLNQLEAVNGVIQVKSQIAQQSEVAAKLMDDLRSDRNASLSESDWTQFNDSPLTDTKKQEWANYRQSLRNLPANTTDPRDITWPTKPDL
jgi:aryl-phospho-beta-D-glucosidase BglC (GH1 family)